MFVTNFKKQGKMTGNLANQVSLLLKVSKRILLVENDPVKRADLVAFLNKHNHEVVAVKDGMSALEKINNETFDLLVIDKNLPFNDAVTLYQSIRNKNLNISAIFITNKKQSGTDDFYTVEYREFKNNFVEILKKIIENNLRENLRKSEIEKGVYRIGAFTLDPQKRLLRYKDNAPIKLTPKESKLLKLLITHNNKLVHKSVLQKKVWHNDENVSFSSMNVYISRLRKLLKKDKNVNIKNVYKTGFKISD